MGNTSGTPHSKRKTYYIPNGATPLLTPEEQEWWLMKSSHPVRTLLWRLAAEREKVNELRKQLEGRK